MSKELFSSQYFRYYLMYSWISACQASMLIFEFIKLRSQGDRQFQQNYQQSMQPTHNKSKRIRAVSARPIVSRPQSCQSKGVHKTEFIENVYGNSLDRTFGAASIRRSFNLIGSKAEMQSLAKYVPKNGIKDKQQLFEENLQLRKQANKLAEQMAILKGQMQNMKKPMTQTTKQLNMQFEKEMYWTGSNTHMVAGVKAQYQKLKQKYQAKCDQCYALKSDVQYLQVQEFKIYSEALEHENKRLIEKLEKYISHAAQFAEGMDRNQVDDYQTLELQQTLQRMQKRLSQTETKLKTSRQVIQDRDKKVMFLEKLILEKDNSQYHSYRKAKKLQKEKISLEEETHSLANALRESREENQNRITRLRASDEKKYEIEKGVFDRTIYEREGKIEKLEKEVAYLSTLLTYWKPLDQINKEVADKILSKEESLREDRESIAISNSVRFSKNQSRIGGNMVPVKNRRGSSAADQFGKSQFFMMKNDSIGNLSKVLESKSEMRVRQTADSRHSEFAQKKRKIKFQEVEQIGNLLKFRFIAQTLSIEDVKRYFDFKQPEQLQIELNTSQVPIRQQPWQATYITMGQVKQILMTRVFNLKEEQANEFARYLVEDSNQEYVYCDDSNQIARGVIKSIVRATVGDYEIYDQESQKRIEFQLQDIVEKYKENIGPALRTLAASGFVSKKKFFELVGSLGIQLSEECRELFIARMAIESESLAKLKYGLFF